MTTAGLATILSRQDPFDNSGEQESRDQLGGPAMSACLGVTDSEDRLPAATLHWLGSVAAGRNLWNVPAN